MNEIKPVSGKMYWIQTPDKNVVLAWFFRGHGQHYFMTAADRKYYTYKYQPKEFIPNDPLAIIVKELEEPPEPVLEPGFYWVRHRNGGGKQPAKVVQIYKQSESGYATIIGMLNVDKWEIGPRVEPPDGWSE